MEMGETLMTRELINIIEEIFERVHGSFLDEGSKLIETINKLDHRSASIQISGITETIAGHVYHLMFYIRVMREYNEGIRIGKTDWNESWKVKEVSENEWKNIISDLSIEYQKLKEYVVSLVKVEKEDKIKEILGIVCHSSYHLGAIRQLIELVE
jgi:hypothetical protein